jgi:hypothetical protein
MADDDDEGIHRVDTVPPPDGEGDAYNAPTRVGAGPPEAVLESLRQAAATGLPLKPPSLPRTAAAQDAAPAAGSAPTPGVAPEAPATPPSPAPPAAKTSPARGASPPSASALQTMIAEGPSRSVILLCALVAVAAVAWYALR